VKAGKNTFALNPDASTVGTAVAGPAASAVAIAAPAHTAEADEPVKRRLSFTDAAEDVLHRHGKGQPMHYRDITQKVLDEDLVKTSGKTPEATLYAQVITENARAEKRGKAPRFVRHGKGMVGLAAWPQPDVQHAIAKHNAEAADEMLQQLRNFDPAEFEQVVGELLRALGIRDVEVTAYHGDKGIDATGVYELASGLEVRIGVQAKRQQQNIQRPVVQALNGSLKPHQQGLIITTSDFGKGAREEAAREDKPLIWLINGTQLVRLLIANDIGARRIPVELVESAGFDLDVEASE
jgi:restriction system protein